MKEKLLKIIGGIKPAEIISAMIFLLVAYYWFRFDVFPKTWLLAIIVLIVSFALSLIIKSIINNKLLKIKVLDSLKFVRNWLPIVLIVAAYDGVHNVTHLINPKEFDPLLIKIDQFLFFGHHPTLIFEKIVHPILSSWFSFSYSFYVLLIPITLGIFYLYAKGKAFQDASLAFVIVLSAGILIYLLVPCFGPGIAQQDLYSTEIFRGFGTNMVLGGQVYNRFFEFYASLRNYLHCFPSLHVGITLVLLYFIHKEARVFSIIYFPIVISIWLSTLYLRWHYVIDDIAGMLIAIFAIWIALRINRRWRKSTPL